MRRVISLIVLVAFALAGGTAYAATTEKDPVWDPWWLKRQNLTIEEFAAAIAANDRTILRVSPEDYARHLGNIRGLAAPSDPKALADFLDPRKNPDISVKACTPERVKLVKMGRVDTTGAHFDFNYMRSECGKGEMWLFYKGSPIISLWCGNIIVPPLAPEPVKAADNCYLLYFEARSGDKLLSREVRLEGHVWLKADSKEAQYVANDPCFRVWDRNKTQSWIPPRLCEGTCAEGDEMMAAPQGRHRRTPDYIYEVILKNGAGYFSVPRWYIDAAGQSGAEFLFCSPDVSFRKPNTRAHQGKWWWWEDTATYAPRGNPTNDPMLFLK
jgi:hypothetical protein